MLSRDSIGEESYAVFKKSDIGDIYGIKGYAFRTKTGEISIHAEELTLLSKSASDFTREVPWSYRYRCTLSSEIY